MTSFYASLSLLVLLLVTSTIDGRKDAGEYWKSIMTNQIMPETIRSRLPVVPVSGEDASSTQTGTSTLNILGKFSDFDPDKRSVRPQYIYHGQNQDTEPTTRTSSGVDFLGRNEGLQSAKTTQDRYFWFYDRPKQEK